MLLVAHCLWYGCRFLQAAAELARSQWTQFNMPLMLLGLLLFTACLLLQAHTLWSSLVHQDHDGSSTLPSHCWRLALPVGAAVLGLLHAAGLFSISFLFAEGQMVCFLVAAFSLLLLHAALAATMQQCPAEVDVQAYPCTCSSGGSPGTYNKLLLSESAATGAHGPSQQDSSDRRPGKQRRSASAAGHGRSLYHKSHVQQMHWNRQCWHAAVWGVGLLVVNALMGSMGLVVRTGHDAMHKAAPTQEPAQHMQTVADTLPHLILPGVGNVHAFASTQWLSAALLETQNLLAPLVCVLIFPFVLIDANTIPVCGRSYFSKPRLHMLAVHSLWFSYYVLALYWVTCQAGQAGASVSFLFEQLLTASELHLGTSATQTLCTVAGCVPSCMHVLSRCLHQPFHLLMPHTVFLSSAFSITALMVSEAEDQWQPKDAVKHQASSSKACTCIAALTAPILLVLGPPKGLVCALALLQCTGVVKLLQYAQTYHSSASSRVGAGGTVPVVRQPEGWLGVAEGCIWALVGTQLFFCSGHFCEFAGLQYAAGQRALLIMQAFVNGLHEDFLPKASWKGCNRFAIIALPRDAKAY